MKLYAFQSRYNKATKAYHRIYFKTVTLLYWSTASYIDETQNVSTYQLAITVDTLGTIEEYAIHNLKQAEPIEKIMKTHDDLPF